MFTGIVEEIGRVVHNGPSKGSMTLSVACQKVLEGTQLGDSIAINGVCLTVISFDKSTFTVEVAPETLRKTNLGEMIRNQKVNLERALTPSSRMGGHFVQGHVDGKAQIMARRHENASLWFEFKAPEPLMKYIVPKGFIAIDGISLTVVDVKDDLFSIMLVTFTQTHVTLAQKAVADSVNLEVDILGKYVERILGLSKTSDPLNRETLRSWGYNA